MQESESSDILKVLKADCEVLSRVCQRGETRFLRRGRLFAVLGEARWKVKLSPSRISQLLGQKCGKRCRPAPDRAEWEWLLIRGGDDHSADLVLEARNYVMSLEHCGSRPA